MRHYCTYFDKNYLTRGLALHNSLLEHSREPFVLWVLCFDIFTYQTLEKLSIPTIRLISETEFLQGDTALQATQRERSRVEFYWTCTPSLPLRVLRQHPEAEMITYLDADLYFYADPKPIFDELGDGSILIVEHRYASEHMHQAETSGIYNVGLVGFRNDANGLACLQRWRMQCIDWCYQRVENGKFGDQKYLDDWPSQFHGVVILRHKGAGLAPWNATRHPIAGKGQVLTVGGKPLIFYHFHGFRFMSRNWAIPAAAKYTIPTAIMGRLYLPYARELMEIGSQLNNQRWEETAGIPDSLLSLTKALSHQQFVLLGHSRLATVLWRMGAWRRRNMHRVVDGLRAFEGGNLAEARKCLVGALWREPYLLRQPHLLTILLKSLIPRLHAG